MKKMINQKVMNVRNFDWPIKTYLSFIREEKFQGNNIIDIGSSVEVDNEQSQKLIEFFQNISGKININDWINYPSSWGLLSLREAIANFFYRKTSLTIDPATEVMVTGGAIKAVDLFIQSTSAEYFIIPEYAPYFVKSLAILRGKKIIIADFANGIFNLKHLNESIRFARKNSIAMYFSIPIAPAGILPNENHIEQEFLPFLIRHKIPVICDTHAYSVSYTAGKSVKMFMSYKSAKEIGVEIITLSKEYGLPGVRIGGAVGNESIINAMRLVATASIEMLPLANQKIAAEALNILNPDLIGEKLKILVPSIAKYLKEMNWPFILPDAGVEMLVQTPKDYCDLGITDSALLAAMSISRQYGVGLSPAMIRDGKYLKIMIKQPSEKLENALKTLSVNGFKWDRAITDQKIVKLVVEKIKKLDLTNL